MRKLTPIVIALAASFAAAPIALDRASTPPTLGLATASAATNISVSLFFSDLSPYGNWVPSQSYNYIWVPANVDANWSPYTNGHWVWTQEYGWYFVSDEPFAWIVYHYGRWGYDPAIGWYWVPGTEWGPAWVAWRTGTTNIGWAPLPPEGLGYSTSIRVSINITTIPTYYWYFVPVVQFVEPRPLITIVIRGDSQPQLLQDTKPAGTVIVQNNTVINNVVNINFIEQQTKQKVEVTKVQQVTDPKQSGQDTGTNTIRTFVAQATQPAKTDMPQKVVANITNLTTPTKGQAKTATTTTATATATVGALPQTDKAAIGATTTATGNANANPGGAPSDPRCLDQTFAKNNPKTCATTAAPGNNGPNTASTGTPGAGNAGAGNGPGSNANGNAGANANANAKADPRCTDATFAKNNPKTCGTSPTTNGPAANATTGAGGAPQGPGGPAANGNTTLQGNTNLGAGGNANVQGGGNAAARCTDPTFAKNNPKTCGVQGNANTGAGASGGAAGGPNANTNVQGSADAGAGAGKGGQGNVTVQGNANVTGGANVQGGGNPAARCSDPTFAKNNPKTCGVQGNANAGAAGGGASNTDVQGSAGAGAGGSNRGNITVQGNAGNTGVQVQGGGNAGGNNANRCADPVFAKANPKTCMPQGNAPAAQAPSSPY